MGVLLVVFLLIIFSVVIFRSATKLPDNNPEAFLESGKRAEKVVVCIGDSITHGRVSHNYVAELERRHADTQYSFVNAGINTELVYNVLQRIDPIIQSDPDFITILIGSNDVLATLNEKNSARYVKEMKLPQSPNRRWYEENLVALVELLQQKTTAKIALLSLPPVTEDKTHTGYQRAADYSRFIKQLALERNLTYLPLNEAMTETLRKKNQWPKSSYEGGDATMMYGAILSFYLLQQSWDDIATGNDFVFLTDSIHLNGKGAKLAADLIDGFLSRKGLSE
jgi:lysophospholipase L1-like esterase